ncbi:MAG TPA: GntR family transcriptional regulator [Candidatus Egerieimonas intestinavium]|uniref:GntR family transcriptional regulator n=1 Tax=Candidatus Egerieimonas intestinavium TaxID=2840777 RepID=A0A9D1EIC0_9FIRM|nr:GntR family transcriptional regulator [Candidatus Egerieimonas intestinavium]
MKVKSNLDAIIYEHIVDSLILGEYSMGQTILLDEFAEKYEVSRTPVTQAVKLLVSDGLLEAMSNGRVRVPVFDKEQMRKICEVRLLMENYAVEKIFEMGKAGDGLCQTLQTIADQGIQALHGGDKLKFNRRDLEFHNTLIGACGNEYLSSEYKRIQGKFIVANYLIEPLEGRNFEKAAQSHLHFTELMAQEKKEECQKVLREHIFSFSTPFDGKGISGT